MSSCYIHYFKNCENIEFTVRLCTVLYSLNSVNKRPSENMISLCNTVCKCYVFLLDTDDTCYYILLKEHIFCRTLAVGNSVDAGQSKREVNQVKKGKKKEESESGEEGSDDEWETDDGSENDDEDVNDFDDPNEMFADEETKSRFTEYSMSSSVLPRNKGLRQLDDHFEKVTYLDNSTSLFKLTLRSINCNEYGLLVLLIIMAK
jgi:hypothetical protein